MMWSEKYRPKNIVDLVGNEEARHDFVEWFTKWKKGTKPILLVGPPGVGKTTLAKLAAKQFGYDMIELNASDVRNKGRIQEILQPILGSERSEEHTSELQSLVNLVCRLLLEKKKNTQP